MLVRLISSLLAALLLLVSSGAALALHERLEHADVAATTPDPSAVLNRVPAAPNHPPRVPHGHECVVCASLLHFIALAVVVLFLLINGSRPPVPRAFSLTWPALVGLYAPRSTRGPPELVS